MNPNTRVSSVIVALIGDRVGGIVCVDHTNFCWRGHANHTGRRRSPDVALAIGVAKAFLLLGGIVVVCTRHHVEVTVFELEAVSVERVVV